MAETYSYLAYTADEINEKLAKIDNLAKKSEIPTKNSDLANDTEYISSSQLNSAVDTALADAKASGEFNGANGIDGTSTTHSWDGTILTITSSSGTSSADLKGDTGADGTKWHSGTAVTADNTPILMVSGAKIGDYYLNTNTYNYYLADSTGIWVKQGCFKGTAEDIGVSGNAVLYTEQSLSDEEKYQARINIGAIAEDELFVTMPGPETITWDGSFEGLECDDSFGSTVLGLPLGCGAFYKICDISPNALAAIRDMVNADQMPVMMYKVSYSENSGLTDYEEEIPFILGLGEGAGIMVEEDNIIIYIGYYGNIYDGYIGICDSGIWYNEYLSGQDGLGSTASQYYISSLTFSGVPKKVINPNLLPENFGSGNADAIINEAINASY